MPVVAADAFAGSTSSSSSSSSSRSSGYSKPSSSSSSSGYSKPSSFPALRPKRSDDFKAPSFTPSPTSPWSGHGAEFRFPPPAPAPTTTTRQSDYSKPPVGSGSQPGTNSTSDYTKPRTTQQQSGYSKPGTVTGASALAPTTAVDRTIARSQSKAALAQFQSEQRQYKPPVAAPSTPKAAQDTPIWRNYGTRWHSADDYYRTRNAAVGWLPPAQRIYIQQPPIWVQQGPSSFGAFSAGFLGGLVLGNIGNHQYDSWAYSHWTDPGVVAWREQMQQDAQNNAELKAKLDALNARVADLQAQHAPVTDKLPDGVDPSLVVAPQTVMLATAKSGFNWWWVFGPLLAIALTIGFIAICIKISRNRSRFA